LKFTDDIYYVTLNYMSNRHTNKSHSKSKSLHIIINLFELWMIFKK